MDYEMKMIDREIYGREIGEKVAEKRERRAGVKKLIDVLIDLSHDDETIFIKAKNKYGQYFSDDELKQFIAEAKNDSLQEAQSIFYVKKGASISLVPFFVLIQFPCNSKITITIFGQS